MEVNMATLSWRLSTKGLAPLEVVAVLRPCHPGGEVEPTLGDPPSVQRQRGHKPRDLNGMS